MFCCKLLFHRLSSEWFFLYSVPISIDKTADFFIMNKVKAFTLIYIERNHLMKTQALKGMRDLLPAEQTLRDYIQGKILETYRASGFERVCGILLEQGYQIPGAKQKIALLYGKDADFTAVLAKAADLRSSYNVTVLQQAKKLGKQLGQLEASGFSGAAFMDKDEIKIFAQQ